MCPDTLSVRARKCLGFMCFVSMRRRTWVRVSQTGNVTVSPPAGTRLGNVSFGVTVTTPYGSATTLVYVTVIATPDPPEPTRPDPPPPENPPPAPKPPAFDTIRIPFLSVHRGQVGSLSISNYVTGGR